MFTGFRETTIDTGEARILVRHHPGRGADAEPVVLLHGHPRTSATWHRVAPALVERGFAVVCPDLRGYGRSRGPGPASGHRGASNDHRGASKRAMARDVVAVTSWWHWFFYAQPEKPERAILADPDAWYAGDPEVMGEENHAEFRAATRDPEVVRAMLEDYRASLTIDRDEEEDSSHHMAEEAPEELARVLGDFFAEA